MSFHAYILQSDSDLSYYIGHTADLADRIQRHNDGRSIYTRSRRPWGVVYSEELPTRSAAMRRERELKGLHRRDLLATVINQHG